MIWTVHNKICLMRKTGQTETAEAPVSCMSHYPSLTVGHQDSIRNTSYDGSRSIAHRAIIPKNIKAYQTMNFAASASLMWTRYYRVHIFLAFL